MILLKLYPKMETLLRLSNTELTGVNLHTSNLQFNLYRVSWVLVGVEFSLMTFRFTSLVVHDVIGTSLNGHRPSYWCSNFSAWTMLVGPYLVGRFRISDYGSHKVLCDTPAATPNKIYSFS